MTLQQGYDEAARRWHRGAVQIGMAAGGRVVGNKGFRVGYYTKDLLECSLTGEDFVVVGQGCTLEDAFADADRATTDQTN